MGTITDASTGVLAAVARGETFADHETTTTVLAEEDGYASGRFVRHPCDVTADRLANHSEKYADQLTPNEQRAIVVVLAALAGVAQGRA